MESESYKGKTYLISDTHFNRETRNKEIKDFFYLLKIIEQDADRLFLVGDIFDFYFEYRNVIPRNYFDIFCEFKKLKDKGIEIHYWAGNHDFWLGEFIQEIGIEIHNSPATFPLGNRTVLIEHGNEIDSPEYLRKFFTCKISRLLFSIIHPDIGINLARIISRISRYSSDRDFIDQKPFIRHAKTRFKNGIDFIIMGHLHKPLIYRDGNRAMFILGDWTHYRSFGIISNGKISLKRFTQSPR